MTVTIGSSLMAHPKSVCHLGVLPVMRCCRFGDDLLIHRPAARGPLSIAAPSASCSRGLCLFGAGRLKSAGR